MLQRLASLARRIRQACRNFSLEELREVGLIAYAQHFFWTALGRKRRIKVNVFGTPLLIRSSTPDIRVAMTSLGDEFEPLAGLLPADFDGLIVDAGGYIGTASLKLASLYPKAKIVLLEPSSENFAMSQANTAAQPAIDCLQVALCSDAGGRSKDDKIVLKNRGTGEWGFTIVDQPLDHPDAVSVETVGTTSLADLLAAYGAGSIGILKLDIEGGEYSLLATPDDALRNAEILFVELHDRIVAGCKQAFEDYSAHRQIIKTEGEKYLSLKTPLS